MFNAQRLLGQLLREAAGGGLGGRRRPKRGGSFTGLPRGLESKVGMGLLGLAVAAFEHFRQQSSGTGTQGPGMTAASATPSAAMAAGYAPTPPPPPPPGTGARAEPPPAIADEAEQRRDLHLLRAMIAAANADGVIDDDERRRLLGHAGEAGLGEEDLAALEREIRSPLSPEQLILQTPQELRDEVYLAALVAIQPDTPAENAFLQQLAEGLSVDAALLTRLIKHTDAAAPAAPTGD